MLSFVTAASTGAISTNNGTGVFIIEGKGNGHGAGMSQKGAVIDFSHKTCFPFFKACIM